MADTVASGSASGLGSGSTSTPSAIGTSGDGPASAIQEEVKAPQESGMEVDVDVEAGQSGDIETIAPNVVAEEGGEEGEGDMEIQLDSAETDTEADVDTAEDMVIEAGPSHIGKRVKVCHRARPSGLYFQSLL